MVFISPAGVMNKMAFVKKTYEEMLKEISPVETTIEDSLSPVNNPDCFRTVKGYGSTNTFLSSGYLQSVYERAGIDYDPYAFRVIANEQVSNMVDRAHKGDKTLEAQLTIVKGKKGCVLRFKDSGTGFDYTKRTKQQSGAGRDVFGMKGIESAYEGNGSILNILIMDRN
jgi:hypothetical protein